MTNQEFIDQIAVYVKKYAAIFGFARHGRALTGVSPEHA